MPSDDVVNEIQNTLPPIITNNPRERLEADQVMLADIKLNKDKSNAEFQGNTIIDTSVSPEPKHALEITWSPNVICLRLEDDVNVVQLRIWNTLKRSLYIRCCGFWEEAARLGASWCCYPKTRLLLAPGLMSSIFVKAIPKDFTPIPYAHLALQVATGHMRDNVVGYYRVPIQVKFEKYHQPLYDEDG